MAQRRDRRVAVRNHDEAREFTSGRRIPEGSGLSDYALPATVDQPRGGIAFPGDTMLLDLDPGATLHALLPTRPR